jgi:hypothetical protein
LRTTIVGLDVTQEIIARGPFFDALKTDAGSAYPPYNYAGIFAAGA